MKKILFTLFLFCSLSVFSNNEKEINITKNSRQIEKVITSKNLNFEVLRVYEDAFGSIKCYVEIFYNGELVHTVHSIGFGDTAEQAIASCKKTVMFLALRYIGAND